MLLFTSQMHFKVRIYKYQYINERYKTSQQLPKQLNKFICEVKKK